MSCCNFNFFGQSCAIQRNRLDYVGWNDRYAMLEGRAGCRSYLYSIAPHGTDFVIYPPLDAQTELILIWEGLKQDFADGDVVPFPSQAAEAVAAYVKARILRTVNKDYQGAELEDREYKRLRLSLFREEQEKLDAEKTDEDFIVDQVAPPGMGNSGFDPEITSWADLMALPTVGVTLPYVKTWIDSTDGLYHVTRLLVSTDATDTASGVARADDYSASNTKVWFQVGSAS